MLTVLCSLEQFLKRACKSLCAVVTILHVSVLHVCLQLKMTVSLRSVLFRRESGFGIFCKAFIYLAVCGI